MRDTITIGTIAGVVATTVMTLYKAILFLLGFQFISTWDSAAKIFLDASLIYTPIGYFIGFLGQYVLGSIFGVTVAYMLRFTGKDFYLLKGIGVGTMIWLGSLGFMMRILAINLHGRSHVLTIF